VRVKRCNNVTSSLKSDAKSFCAPHLENLALRQQLAIFKRRRKRPRLNRSERVFWMVLAKVWKDWRQALVVVHPDTVVRWQRRRFGRYWANLSVNCRGKLGRPSVG